jgi:mRNA interferase MazF
MPSPSRSEVWLVDLGLTTKVRPGLVISVPAGPQDRALTALVAHTTSLRSSRFEVAVPERFLLPRTREGMDGCFRAVQANPC